MSSLLTTNEGKKMDDEQSSSTNGCVEKLKKYIYQVSELAFKDGGEVPILQGISTHYRRAVQGIINGSKGKYLPPEVISTIIFDLVNMLQSISYKDKAAYSTILAFGNMQKNQFKKENGEIDNKLYLSELFDLLNCLLAPNQKLETFLGSLKEKKPVCGKVFRDGDLAYTCLDCRTDGTCVFCEECFINSNHVGHRVRYHRTGAGGICDCGDHEAWDPAGFCDQHCGLGGNPGDTLPEPFKKSCEIVINNVVKYLTIYSMQDYGSFSTLPKSDDDNEEWMVCLHNDDKHTYQNVIDATTGTFALIEHLTELKFLSPDKKGKAAILTEAVDKKGYGVVYRGAPDICKQVAKKIKDHGLIVSIKSGTWEIETAISVFFTSWLRFISDSSASIASYVSKIICNLDIANNPYVDINKTDIKNALYEGKMDDAYCIKDHGGHKHDSSGSSNNNNNNSSGSNGDRWKSSSSSSYNNNNNNNNNNNYAYIVEELKDVKLYRKFKNIAVFWVPGFTNVTPVYYAYNEDKAEWSWSPYKPKELSDLSKFFSVSRITVSSGRYSSAQLATINKNIVTFLHENPDLGRNYLNFTIREDAWQERSSKRQKLSYNTVLTQYKAENDNNNSTMDVDNEDEHVSIELLIKYDDLLPKPIVLALHDLYAVLWTSDASFKSTFSIYYVKNLPSRCYKYVQGIGTDDDLLERLFCVQVFTTPSIVEMLSLKFDCISSILAGLHLSFVDQFDEKSKRLALSSWGIANERTRLAYDHLYYMLRIPVAARIFVWKDSTSIGLFLLFVSYFQEMTSFQRKENTHVLYENDQWQNALNQMIRLGSRFYGVLTAVIVNEDVSFTGNDSQTTLKERKKSAKASLLNFSEYVSPNKLQKLPMLSSNNYISSDLYKDVCSPDNKDNPSVLYARTAISQAMVTFSSWAIRSNYIPLVRILDTPIGTYPVFMFDVAKESTSIYYPLNTFIAMLIYRHESKLDTNPRKRRKNSTLNGLFPISAKEAFKSQRVFTKGLLSQIKPRDIYQVSCIEEGVSNVGGATWLGRLLLMEIPLRTAAYTSQVLRGLWVRNGRGLYAQSIHFTEPPFCVLFNDMVIKMLQIGIVGVGVDHFLTCLIDRFGLTTWLYDEYEIRGINQKKEYKTKEGVGRFGRDKAMEITSECLRLLINLVSNLTSDNDDSDFNLRKEAIHILASGPKRRSEMMKRLRQVTGQTLFDLATDPEIIWNKVESHLEQVATFRDGEEGEPGTYLLKKQFMSEYDPYFKHLTREEHNKVREKYLTNRSEIYLKGHIPHPPVHKLGPCIENFQAVREMLLSPALLEMLRPLLARAENGKLSSDVRSSCLHLLGLSMMYLNEKRADGQDGVCVRFLRAIGLRHPCGINETLVVDPEIEDGSVLQSLISLYENQAEETYDNEEKVEREAYDYIFTCLKSHDRDYTMCGQIKESITMAEALKDATKSMLDDNKKKNNQNDNNSGSGNNKGKSDKEDGKATQNAVMEAMQKQQQAFLAMMDEGSDSDSDSDSNDDESSSDDDDDDDYDIEEGKKNSGKSEGSSNSSNDKSTCIFCHEDITTKLYGYIGFSYVPIEEGQFSYAVKCCSHVSHIECLDVFLAMQNGRRDHTIDTTDNAEFLCPLCKRLSNTLVPVIPHTHESISKVEDGSDSGKKVSSEFTPEFSPSDLLKKLNEVPCKKISFIQKGANAELLRFLTTISNNKYRIKEPDRLHRPEDMVKLLWQSGIYSLNKFVNGAIGDNSVDENALRKEEGAFNALGNCMIASNSVIDGRSKFDSRLNGVFPLCDDARDRICLLTHIFQTSLRLEQSLINACQYSDGDKEFFRSLFQVLYVAYILTDIFLYDCDEEDKSSASLLSKIMKEYMQLHKNVVVERKHVELSYLHKRRKKFIALYLFCLNAMDLGKRSNYQSLKHELQKYESLEDMEQYLNLANVDDILYNTRWASWMKCWFPKEEIRNYLKPALDSKDKCYRTLGLDTILDELEPQYDRLLARFKVQLTRLNNERIQPCLCLACGTVISGGEKDANNVGACHRHINEAGGCNSDYHIRGIGIMLDLKSTQIILIRGKWAAYYPSLYVDKYGETDGNMRRGAPLHLNTTRVNKLKNLWFSGAISNEVVRIRSSSDRIIMENWY